MRRRRFGWPCRRRPWCRRFGPWGSRVSSRRTHSGSRRGRLGSPKRRWGVTPGPAPKRRIARGWCHRMDRSRLFRLVRWRTCTRGTVACLDEQDQTTQCQRRRRATDCHDPFRSPARPARSGALSSLDRPSSIVIHVSFIRALEPVWLWNIGPCQPGPAPTVDAVSRRCTACWSAASDRCSSSCTAQPTRRGWTFWEHGLARRGRTFHVLDLRRSRAQ
jgi:hypothetical protein